MQEIEEGFTRGNKRGKRRVQELGVREYRLGSIKGYSSACTSAIHLCMRRDCIRGNRKEVKRSTSSGIKCGCLNSVEEGKK